jgi:hypothetical protein
MKFAKEKKKYKPIEKKSKPIEKLIKIENKLIWVDENNNPIDPKTLSKRKYEQLKKGGPCIGKARGRPLAHPDWFYEMKAQLAEGKLLKQAENFILRNCAYHEANTQLQEARFLQKNAEFIGNEHEMIDKNREVLKKRSQKIIDLVIKAADECNALDDISKKDIKKVMKEAKKMLTDEQKEVLDKEQAEACERERIKEIHQRKKRLHDPYADDTL